MAKKITLTTVKSFIRKNRAELHIAVLSQFDGMIDCVSACKDQSFKPIVAPPTKSGPFKVEGPDHQLGISGAWFVFQSRDYFTAYDENGFRGIEVSNSCGRFVLAVKRPLEIPPTLLYALPPQDPAAPYRWSGDGMVPEPGDRVAIKCNGLGTGQVIGYQVEGELVRWLGVWVALDANPDWRELQGKTVDQPAFVFGAELDYSLTAPRGWDKVEGGAEVQK